ncbi:MAG: hypothetical protein U1E62_08700 [Alsobacter sp.]
MHHPPPTLSREDYDAIEAAVMETARGRWFLSEYARRNRQADTDVLLQAIQRLERSIAPGAEAKPSVTLRREISGMAEALLKTKLDLAKSIADATGLTTPPEPERVYDDVVKAAEKADDLVASAAEHVQEISWSIREGADGAQAVADLDRQALGIYRASSQHAMTTTRIRQIVSVLREMESRIQAIMARWADDVTLVDPLPEVTLRRHTARDDGPDTVLATAPPRIKDDIVFIEPRIDDRRRAEAIPPEPANLDLKPVSVAPRDAPGPDAPARLAALAPRPRGPFDEIDAWPDVKKLAVFI